MVLTKLTARATLARQNSAKRLAGVGLLALLALGGGGCAENQGPFKRQIPPQIHIWEALSEEDKDQNGIAISKLNNAIYENSGTRLSSLASLKLAELHFEREEWKEAEVNYRLYLSTDSQSHLVPYTLYKLFLTTYYSSLTGFLTVSPEVDRNASRHQQLLVEYKRFYLLYPNSIYIQKIQPYYQKARETLARYEVLVGDFYFDHEEYNSAIGRYVYALRHYPDYAQSQQVVDKLIEAYKLNQQPGLAEEMAQIKARLFSGPDGAVSQAALGAPLGGPEPAL